MLIIYMPGKKHNGFTYQPIVLFILIFLNCVLSAAPFLHASPVNKTAINTSCLPPQNHSTNQEENNHPNKVLDEQQEYHVTVRNKQKLPILISRVKSDQRFATGKHPCNLQLADTYFLVRPHYYTFLSLYHLF